MLVYTGKDFTVDALLAADRDPHAWRARVPHRLGDLVSAGFNLLFELPPLAGEDDPRVPSWRQRGVEALRQATLLDGVPPWLPNLAAQMLTKQGGRRAGAAAPGADLRGDQRRGDARADPRASWPRCADRRWPPSSRARPPSCTQLIDERYPYAPEAFSLIAGPRFVPAAAPPCQARPTPGADPP